MSDGGEKSQPLSGVKSGATSAFTKLMGQTKIFIHKCYVCILYSSVRQML